MKRVIVLKLLLAAVLLTACAGAVGRQGAGPTDEPAATGSPPGRPTESVAGPSLKTETPGDRLDAPATARADDPVSANTAAPTVTPRRNRRVDMSAITNYPKYVPFDGILPIYDPEFVPAGEAPFEDDELVLAITLEGEAKAYPITVLRGREMVNDELAGIPILATW